MDVEYSYLGGVPARTGAIAGDGLLVGLGVALLLLPLNEERLADNCAALIFLRNTLRRDRAPSITASSC